MANINDKLPQNVVGSYYVDSSCVDCDLCRNTAPNFFKRDDDAAYSFVYQQPVDAEERDQAEQAMRGCPTESIGCDGQAAANPASISVAEQ